MDFLKGYRTILVNVLALAFSIAAGAGLDISPEDQGTITTGILAFVNIIMRMVTDTAVGKKS